MEDSRAPGSVDGDRNGTAGEGEERRGGFVVVLEETVLMDVELYLETRS